MSSKQDKIKKLLEMQRKFIDYEHEHGVDPMEYWAADEGHPLHGYRQEYLKLAMEVVDDAHKEVGSSRL
jgi:type II secretory pathway predicted ATPase ExeA